MVINITVDIVPGEELMFQLPKFEFFLFSPITYHNGQRVEFLNSCKANTGGYCITHMNRMVVKSIYKSIKRLPCFSVPITEPEMTAGGPRFSNQNSVFPTKR